MDHDDPVVAALAILGLDRSVRDADVVRRAYLTAIRATHPDRSRRHDATERTAAVTVAYRVVLERLAAGDLVDAAEPIPAAGGHAVWESGRDAAWEAALLARAGVRVLSDDTIEIDAPLDLAYGWVVLAGHEIGDVTFLDRSAPLLQIIVQFVDEPVCQMIFDFQGRAARGTTEVFCTIDSIEDRPPPPIAEVTALVAEQIAVVSAW